MITERTLNKWRAEALREIKALEAWDSLNEFTKVRRELSQRILRLTQELLDQHLLAKAKARGAANAEKRFDKATKGIEDASA